MLNFTFCFVLTWRVEYNCLVFLLQISEETRQLPMIVCFLLFIKRNLVRTASFGNSNILGQYLWKLQQDLRPLCQCIINGVIVALLHWDKCLKHFVHLNRDSCHCFPPQLWMLQSSSCPLLPIESFPFYVNLREEAQHLNFNISLSCLILAIPILLKEDDW